MRCPTLCAPTFIDAASLAEKMTFPYATHSPGLELERLICQNFVVRLHQFGETLLEIFAGITQ
jgi:hypothetical protein